MADLANLRISVDSREVKTAASDLNSLGNAAADTEKKTGGLASAFGGLRGALAGLGFGLIAREIISMADTFSNLQGRLALVTKNSAELAAVQTQLFNMAQQTRVGYESTVELYARLARSTESLGASQSQVLQVTETINKALIVSGTSAQTAAGSLMQLGQAFASGTLRGDELNSVMEGMPRVAQAIAEGMGITVGELRNLGAQGKLTGAEVFNALLKMGDGINQEFGKMPVTVGQSMTVLQNSLMQFIGEINSATGFTEKLSSFIIVLANNLDVLAVTGAAAAAVFALIQAQMAVGNITGYIRSIVQLEMALGAGGTASAIFSAGLKMVQGAFQSLTTTMMANPFIAVATAIAAVTSLLYANRDAQVEVGGGVVRLGDIFIGAFEMIKRAVAFVTTIFREGWAAALGSVSPKLQALGQVFDTVFTWIGNLIRKWVNMQIGFFAGLWAGVKAIFTDQSVVDAFMGAFNVDYIGKAIGTVTSGIKALGDLGAQVRKAGEQSEIAGTKGAIALGKIADAGKKQKGGGDNAIKEYQNYIKQLADEIERIDETPLETKMREIAAMAEAARKAGFGELANDIKRLGAAYETATKAQASTKTETAFAQQIKQIDAQTAALGKSREAIELSNLELEKTAYIAEREVAVGLERATAMWEEYRAARIKGINAQTALDKDLENIARIRSAMEDLFGMIGGSFGKAMSLAMSIKVEMPDGTFKELGDILSKELGAFGKTLGDIMKNATIGGAFGQLTGSNTGGMIGGIIGGSKVVTDMLGGALGKLGTKIGGQVFGKVLGSFAGPLGAIAGGLLGGLIGGLFSKTKTGSATLSQIAGGAMQKTLSGNNAQLKGIADKLANGLLTGLGNIAEQLGGTLGGSVQLSIGMRKKDYVVDPTGMGRTKGSGVINFGEDQAAAVAYATQLAIQQGIITGISAGAQTLIRAGGDLNTQVQKALKFDQVFKDLKKETDPLGASLDELSAEMAKLKAIFAEAGASAEDYAKLEELFAIKQAKAVFEAAKPRRELEIQLMEAQGKTAEALAAKRALELESMDAALRGLQQQVWAAEDAANAAQELADAEAKLAEEAKAAAEAAKELADTRRSLEIDLMEALGDASSALAERRKMELAAMDESLRGLQEQIWAALDAKAAAEAAAEAAKALAEEQAKQLEAANKLAADRRELEIQLLEAQGLAVEALTARRALELEATDASLRALKEQIWAAQAKAEADAIAAKAAEEAAAAQAKAAQDAADAMQKYMETLANVSQTVTEEINRLRGINAASTSVILKAQFATLTAQARTGNLDALAKLPELSKAIETATASSAGSALEVARIRAWLSSSLSETLGAQAASNAEVNTAGAGLIFDGNATGTATTAQTADAISNMRGDLYNALYQIAKNTGKSYELMDRWDGDGLPDIREDASDYY